jgi:hypothetical protein
MLPFPPPPDDVDGPDMSPVAAPAASLMEDAFEIMEASIAAENRAAGSPEKEMGRACGIQERTSSNVKIIQALMRDN